MTIADSRVVAWQCRKFDVVQREWGQWESCTQGDHAWRITHPNKWVETRALANESLLAEAESRIESLTYKVGNLTACVEIWQKRCDDFAQRSIDELRAHQATEEQRDALQSRLDAWKDFAQHQEHCAVCADAVSDCIDGTNLRSAALGGESPANDEELK